MKFLTYLVNTLTIAIALNAPLSMAASSDVFNSTNYKRLDETSSMYEAGQTAATSNANLQKNSLRVGLRDEEKDYLDRVEKGARNRSHKTSDTTTVEAGAEDYNSIKRLEHCQIVLKKIDKLSLEILELEQNARNSYAPHTDSRKVIVAKIKALKSQINRYKTQAKEYCPEKYLRDSNSIKTKGAVKR